MAKAKLVTSVADTSTATTSAAKPAGSGGIADKLGKAYNKVGSQISSTAGKTGSGEKNLAEDPRGGQSTSKFAKHVASLKGETAAKTNPLDAALNKVANREEFSYDPLKDANYQAMAKLYDRQGTKAAQDTMGDAAALNGGYGSSYAMTASQQARNDYNQQLASQIPALQEAAYSKYMNDYNMDLSAYQALKDADDTAYSRNRDTVADTQWQQSFDRDKYESDRAYQYQQMRDTKSDEQWKASFDQSVKESNRDFNYQQSRDSESDRQWAKEYALAKYQAKKANGSSSKSSSRSSKSGNGYVSGKNVNGSKTTSGATGNSKSNSSSDNPYYKTAAQKAKNK